MDNQYVTVSQINRYINNKMKFDENLSDIHVKGEISNYKTYNSGHSYFTLKDQKAQINCVMFSGNKFNLKFEPKDGMNVIIHGNIEVYEKNGQYQLYAYEITEDGLGDLYVAFEQLKKKLKDEGLFDEYHKKPIPTYPDRIGVVTAQTGAAIRDIITTIKRRYPICEVLVFSTLVQGDMAAENIVRQIRNAQHYDLDTLIVGRGGGSIEDLWPFNEEIVAREIYDSNVPVITGIGHETDHTISDFAADLRAPTPTAAAELAVPKRDELLDKLFQNRTRLNRIIEDIIIEHRMKLNQTSRSKIFKNPETIYDVKKMDLDQIVNRFNISSKDIINNNRNKLFKLENSTVLKKPEQIIKSKKEDYSRYLAKLEVLNPLLTLKRGYTITKVNDKVVSSAKDVKNGDQVDIEFDDGCIHTKVI